MQQLPVEFFHRDVLHTEGWGRHGVCTRQPHSPVLRPLQQYTSQHQHAGAPPEPRFPVIHLEKSGVRLGTCLVETAVCLLKLEPHPAHLGDLQHLPDAVHLARSGRKQLPGAVDEVRGTADAQRPHAPAAGGVHRLLTSAHTNAVSRQTIIYTIFQPPKPIRCLTLIIKVSSQHHIQMLYTATLAIFTGSSCQTNCKCNATVFVHNFNMAPPTEQQGGCLKHATASRPSCRPIWADQKRHNPSCCSHGLNLHAHASGSL